MRYQYLRAGLKNAESTSEDRGQVVRCKSFSEPNPVSGVVQSEQSRSHLGYKFRELSIMQFFGDSGDGIQRKKLSLNLDLLQLKWFFNFMFGFIYIYIYIYG